MGKKLRSYLVLVLLVVKPLQLLAATQPVLEPSKTYSATAQILVRDTGPSTTSGTAPSNPSGNNDYFMRTQNVIIQSKPILDKVANRLNLATEWAKDGNELSSDDVYEILSRSINFNNDTNTSIIAITVQRPDPNEAAAIANEIATTFRDSRLDQLRENNLKAKKIIRKSLDKQQARVDAAEKAVDKQLVELDLPPYSEMDTEVDSDSLAQLKADRLAAQQILLEKESLLKIMAELDGKNVIQRAGFISQFDESVVNVIQQIHEIEYKLKALGKEYGPNHPEVKRYRSQKEALEKVLEEHIAAQKRRLEAEHKLAKDKVEGLSVLLFEITKGGGYLHGDEYQPLRRALADLDNEQFIYKVLDKRITEELEKLETAPRSPVDILSLAQPNP